MATHFANHYQFAMVHTMFQLSQSVSIIKACSQLLLLLLSCLGSFSEAALFDGCDHVYNINAGYSYLESPYYPNYYPASTSCRYKFVAPMDYTIRVNCTIEMNKGANACSSEFFYVATDGDTLLRGSEQFCGKGTLDRTSLFRQLVLAYASYGSWGRFRCQLYAAPQPCDCGWTVNTRIVNGVNANLNEFPSMVALRNLDSNSPFCGGAIVSHRYIVTAAHCTEAQPNPARLEALLGEHDLSTNAESRYAVSHTIQQIFDHPGYTSDPVANDISLLLTTKNIEWTRGVGPICLPPASSASNTFAYQNCDVIGFGSTRFAGPTANILQKVTLMILDNNTCRKSYSEFDITAQQMCTYDSTGHNRDSCQFDSGGPVILRRARMFLVGIVSFGRACGQEAYATGVNTRITSYLNWIHQRIATCNVPL